MIMPEDAATLQPYLPPIAPRVAPRFRTKQKMSMEEEAYYAHKIHPISGFPIDGADARPEDWLLEFPLLYPKNIMPMTHAYNGLTNVLPADMVEFLAAASHSLYRCYKQFKYFGFTCRHIDDIARAHGVEIQDGGWESKNIYMVQFPQMVQQLTIAMSNGALVFPPENYWTFQELGFSDNKKMGITFISCGFLHTKKLGIFFAMCLTQKELVSKFVDPYAHGLPLHMHDFCDAAILEDAINSCPV